MYGWTTGEPPLRGKTPVRRRRTYALVIVLILIAIVYLGIRLFAAQ